MRKNPLTILGAAAALVFGVTAGAMALTATPGQIVFNSLDETKTVNLTQNGQPIAKGDINGWTLEVSSHDYDYMLDVEKKDGALSITPTDMLEIGKYSLVVNTDYGKANIVVQSPLSDLPDSLENRAADMGITAEELQHRLGESQLLYKDAETRVVSPGVTYVGQAYPMPPAEDPGVQRRYYIDGQIIEFPSEANTYDYWFEEPGLYDVGYQDLKENKVITAEHGLVTVTEQPPLRYLGSAGSRVDLAGPEGYKDYTWHIDGKTVEAGEHLVHVFSEPGTYDVRVDATGPYDAAHGPTHTMHYVVHVK